MNGIKHIRIDERLIHGQVAAVWTNTLGATRIMIVDDEVVKNDMEKTLLKMACPAHIKLSVLSTETAIQNISSLKYQEDKVFMVVKSPAVLSKLFKNGIKFDAINVGNLSKKGDAVQVKKTVFVSTSDYEDYKYLNGNGVKITSRMIPSEEENDFIKDIENALKNNK